ncbi:unnamed protein product [Owenia fusiformis]|uniref:Uncharacterized protein n=1 Tax=Owenia fusiformis TaxID=6347 RepID=A0A8J1UZZ1_OWEFU|nr:unnamed protein product [Owenia fusiformis]
MTINTVGSTTSINGISADTVGSTTSTNKISSDTVGSSTSTHRISSDTVGSTTSTNEISTDTVGSISTNEISIDTVGSTTSTDKISTDTVVSTTSTNKLSTDTVGSTTSTNKISPDTVGPTTSTHRISTDNVGSTTSTTKKTSTDTVGSPSSTNKISTDTVEYTSTISVMNTTFTTHTNIDLTTLDISKSTIKSSPSSSPYVPERGSCQFGMPPCLRFYRKKCCGCRFKFANPDKDGQHGYPEIVLARGYCSNETCLRTPCNYDRELKAIYDKENAMITTPYLSTTQRLSCVMNETCFHGRCIDGKCKCTQKWKGQSCNEPRCRKKCLHGGICNAPNRCTCPFNRVGSQCRTCRKGYYGKHCFPCPDCNHGRCDPITGDCLCDHGWFGDVCTEKIHNPGGNNKSCTRGMPRCNRLWRNKCCGCQRMFADPKNNGKPEWPRTLVFKGHCLDEPCLVLPCKLDKKSEKQFKATYKNITRVT